MDSVLEYLPKDLVDIIEGYAKDRTNYNKVLIELESNIIGTLFDYEHLCRGMSICQGSSYHCPCDDAVTFCEMITWTADCYEGFITYLNSCCKDKKYNRFITRLLYRIKN